MQKEMQIAYVLPQYLPSTSGDVAQTHELARWLVCKGHKITVYTTDAGSEDSMFFTGGIILPKGEEYIDGVRVLRFAIQSRFPRFVSRLKLVANRHRFLTDYREIEKYVQDLKLSIGKKHRLPDSMRRYVQLPLSTGLRKALVEAKHHDIFHCVGLSLSTAFYAYEASRQNHIPLVVKPSFHSADRLYYNDLNSRILHHASVVVVNTDAETNIFNRFGIDDSKIAAIGCGIDLEQLSTPNYSEIESLRSKYCLDQYECTSLFLSRLQREKGVFDTIEATIRLNAEGKQIQLLVAGSDYEGNSTLIKNIARRFPFIKYLGRVSEEEKRSLLHLCDMLVVPSIVESFCIVYLEAWACKKPVIGADIPSTRSLISYGKDGLYVEYGSVDSIAEHMRFLIENPGNRDSMGLTGYDKVRRKYTKQRIFEDTYKIYGELVEKQCN